MVTMESVVVGASVLLLPGSLMSISTIFTLSVSLPNASDSFTKEVVSRAASNIRNNIFSSVEWNEAKTDLFLVNVFQPLSNVLNGMSSLEFQWKTSEAREEVEHLGLGKDLASQAIECKLSQYVLSIVCSFFELLQPKLDSFIPNLPFVSILKHKLNMGEDGLKLLHLFFHSSKKPDLINAQRDEPLHDLLHTTNNNFFGHVLRTKQDLSVSLNVCFSK
ncbi:hypothetical protein Syun_006295 [Stephania yunnanensis]|uniref:Uncharacterized protein n=1 Tax=Stephania yunnanensis TaxID=152371 RepID=A0AAP0PZ63_9MAGN